MRFPLFTALASAIALTAFGAQAAGDMDKTAATTQNAPANQNASVYDNAGWTFDQFDVDGDGTLSRAEIYGTLFATADENGDDQISNAEFIHFMDTERLRPSGWDLNNDGEITQAEFQEMQSDPTGAEDGRSGVPAQTAQTPEDNTANDDDSMD